MDTFTPTTSEPSAALLNSVEAFLRNGHPQLHDPAPPTWADGDPCPSGHFTLPAGLYLYRDNIPQEAQTPYLLIGIAGDCERHVPDDDRVWDIPLVLHLVQNRDTYESDDTPEVLKQLQNDLFADAAITSPSYTAYPAAERLSTSVLHVYYIFDVRLQKSELFNGHPAHTLLAKIRCAGITPES